MSSHEQNLPQNPPNHLDFTPAIHHTFMADAGQVVEKACADRGYFDNGRTLGQDGPNDPRIHVNDAQEFWDKWIRQETHSDHPKIRGYWILRDWDRTAQTAVVIARYKSLQICVRAQPGAQGIMFVPCSFSTLKISSCLLLTESIAQILVGRPFRCAPVLGGRSPIRRRRGITVGRPFCLQLSNLPMAHRPKPKLRRARSDQQFHGSHRQHERPSPRTATSRDDSRDTCCHTRRSSKSRRI